MLIRFYYDTKINCFFFYFIFYTYGVLGHDTGPEESGKKYRPLFLDHFDKKIAEKSKVIFKINIIFSLF